MRPGPDDWPACRTPEPEPAAPRFRRWSENRADVPEQMRRRERLRRRREREAFLLGRAVR